MHSSTGTHSSVHTQFSFLFFACRYARMLCPRVVKAESSSAEALSFSAVYMDTARMCSGLSPAVLSGHARAVTVVRRFRRGAFSFFFSPGQARAPVPHVVGAAFSLLGRARCHRHLWLCHLTFAFCQPPSRQLS